MVGAGVDVDVDVDVDDVGVGVGVDVDVDGEYGDDVVGVPSSVGYRAHGGGFGGTGDDSYSGWEEGTYRVSREG
ncbi:hypothetical protein TWF718_007011 [Orbilia javanica]|uniref:Uncharacterized protein n=1 Tax=Orbilia javanica TaxID=47235 RepID=A0AAN8MZC3_9PEZI